jgi:hypothetical protein
MFDLSVLPQKAQDELTDMDKKTGKRFKRQNQGSRKWMNFSTNIT